MFCWFLADSVYSMPLSLGTPKILQNGPKYIVKLNVKIKIAFTNFILTFFAAGNFPKLRYQLQIFFREQLPS